MFDYRYHKHIFQTLFIIILHANNEAEKRFSYKDVKNLFNQKYGKYLSNVYYSSARVP